LLAFVARASKNARVSTEYAMHSKEPIMKWPWAIGGPLISAALLLPILAAAESHIQSVAVNGALRATAHVDFKITIPKMLSLDVGTELHRGQGAQRVAIISNNRTVTLGATVHASDADASGTEARGDVILSAAARKIIAQDAACTHGDAHPAALAKTPGSVAVNTGRVVCTVSTP
jgi:hypothetical protein